MIPTIGIDLVEIERFKNWHAYADRQLRKVFTAEEIAYCRAIPVKSTERFAARFAAKEALFKALSAYSCVPVPLLTLCAATEIQTDHRGAHVRISWKYLQAYYPTLNTNNITIQCSLSHTSTTAGAVVMLYFS